jgi:hypothetical protein
LDVGDNDWKEFLRYVTWYSTAGVIEVERPLPSPKAGFRPSKSFELIFPRLTRLLLSATVTRIRTREKYLPERWLALFAWSDRLGRRTGWLCEDPFQAHPHVPLHPDHAILLQTFGGITERFNEPASWLQNLNSAFVESDCHRGSELIPQVISAAPAARKEWLDELTAFAFEANGNTTLYHHRTGQALLFAHDHSFDYVTPLPGFPEYTFYTINGCDAFRDWVETVAEQWLDHVASD